MPGEKNMVSLSRETVGAVPWNLTHLPLAGEVAVTCGDTEEEGIVGGEGFGGNLGNVAGLRGRTHLGQDLLGKSLLDLVKVGGAASGLDTLLLGLGHGLDVAVHRVLQHSLLAL